MGMIGNTLALGLVSGANIQDGSVDTADIKDNAVTNAKLASNAFLLNLGYTPINKAGDALGGGSYTKGAVSTINGNLSFDNGTTDTPGLHFYYGNNTNFGVDVNSSKFRVVKNLDETGGTEIFWLSEAGNLSSLGSITSNGGLIQSGLPNATGSDVGFALYSGDDTGSYSRIRAYQGTGANTSGTIHFFSGAWGGTGNSFESGSKGAININGVTGVTFGGWNAPDATINATRMRLFGDRYSLYGPNTGWGASLQIGGGARVASTYASVITTDGNLHMDASSGGHGMYLNYYNGDWVGVYAGTSNGAFGTLKYGTLSQGSDYRLKDNVVPMANNALDKLMQVMFKQYTLSSYGSRIFTGVIADQFSQVLPYAVDGVKDAVDTLGMPIYQTVDYIQLSVLTSKALQELKAEFDAYKEAHP